MKIVVASDSFKGSLTNQTINEIITDVCKEEMPDCKVVPLLIADGGDGTLDAVISQMHGKYVCLQVNDPLFNKIRSRYGIFGDTAVISMCECSGLTLIPKEKRNARFTTTYGVGELIKDALSKDVKEIYITLGGSATNDGGMGALSALGYKFIKRDGSIAKGIGEELIDVERIDDEKALSFSDVKITVLSDVTNPLTGEKGATKTFARQKGASEKDIEFLEKGMQNFERVLQEYSEKNIKEIVGGGAAGGMGASLSAVLNAEIRSGIESILDLVNFDNVVRDADYVFTGEGKIDEQSKDGKVISGVIKRARKYNVPVVAIVGTIGKNIEPLFSEGLTSVFSLIEEPSPLEKILENSESSYRRTARSVIRLISEFHRK